MKSTASARPKPADAPVDSPTAKTRRVTHHRAVAPARPQPRHAEPTPQPAANDTPTAMRDDPVVDRRIINGMLHDRTTLMTEMAKRGWSSADVLRRAADLGFSEAFIRQVQGVAADLAGERPGAKKTPLSLAARTCLSCDRVFLSSGPGNRLCMRCRGGDAGLAQL